MKSSETTEMTMAEFFVNLLFGLQREGLYSVVALATVYNIFYWFVNKNSIWDRSYVDSIYSITS